MIKKNSSKYKTPPKLLILQFIGLPLLGIGISDKLNEGFKFIPESLQFQNYQWVLIAIGILSIVPELIYIFKFFKSKSKTEQIECV